MATRGSMPKARAVAALATAMPFGLNARGQNAWWLQGGAAELFAEILPPGVLNIVYGGGEGVGVVHVPQKRRRLFQRRMFGQPLRDQPDEVFGNPLLIGQGQAHGGRAPGRARSLRGRARPVDLFEPAPDFPAEDRAQLAKVSALAASDPAAARALAEGVAARHPDDSALGNLARRMAAIDEGGTYVLE